VEEMTCARLIYLFLTYLLGGVPFGFVICKIFKKIDIRERGSGNVGATNVGRVVGLKYAIGTFILDGLKSFLPVLAARFIFGNGFQALVLLFAVMGHVFSLWLGGKGGKGISSAMVGLLALDYRLGLSMILVWLLVFMLSKISSLSALASTVITAFISYFLSPLTDFSIFYLTTLIIFWAHRDNIKRLISGEEVGFKKKS
jgi:glycerol-3-phosphate acyltransferase PlsY